MPIEEIKYQSTTRYGIKWKLHDLSENAQKVNLLKDYCGGRCVSILGKGRWANLYTKNYL